MEGRASEDQNSIQFSQLTRGIRTWPHTSQEPAKLEGIVLAGTELWCLCDSDIDAMIPREAGAGATGLQAGVSQMATLGTATVLSSGREQLTSCGCS